MLEAKRGTHEARGDHLGVVAAFASLASTASAEAPEFGRCVKVAKGTGSFKNANCTIALAGGSYEWLPGPGPGNKFTFSYTGSPSPLWFESVGGNKPACTFATARVNTAAPTP